LKIPTVVEVVSLVVVGTKVVGAAFEIIVGIVVGIVVGTAVGTVVVTKVELDIAVVEESGIETDSELGSENFSALVVSFLLTPSEVNSVEPISLLTLLHY